MRFLFFASFSFFTLFAQPTVWEGSIGSEKAYMQLGCDPKQNKRDRSCQDSYYFQTNTLVNVMLKDIHYTDQEHIVLKSTWNGLSERMSLTLKGNTMDGTLLRGESNIPVLFKRVKNRRLESLKLPLLHFKSVEKEMLKRPGITVEIEWIKERYSEVVYPRLLGGVSAQKCQTLNTLMEKLHKESAMKALSCSDEWSEKSGQALITTIGYVSPKLFSLVYIDMQHCSNGEERRDIYGEMYAMDTGKPYTLEHLIAFSETTPILDSKNKEAWKAYRKNIFAPKMRDFVFASKEWKIGGKEDKECGYSDTQYWENVTWFLGKKGLEIKPDYSGHLTGCRDEYKFVLPVAILKQYRNREYPDVLAEYIEELEKNEGV